MNNELITTMKDWKEKQLPSMTISLYSSMSLTYRLDKDLEMSALNSSYMIDSLFDIISAQKIQKKYAKNISNLLIKNKDFEIKEPNNIVLFNEKGVANIQDVSIRKFGDGNSTYGCGVLGYNSGILSYSNLNLSKVHIQTFANGAKAIYQKNENSNCHINSSIIETYQDNSNAVEVADGSNLKLKNSIIYTCGINSCGVSVSTNSIARIDNLTSFVLGENSPSIYINGKITIKESLIENADSYLAVIEGNSSLISIKNSWRGYKGFKMMNKSIDEEIECNIGINKRYINVEKGYIFITENVSANINLSKINTNSKENLLLKSTSNFDFNKVNVNINDSILFGKISSDINCPIILNLYGDTHIKTEIKGIVSIKIFEENVCFELSESSYIDQINIFDNNVKTLINNVKLNGFILTYNKSKNDWLKGKTFYLNDGSIIKPD